MRIIFLCGSLEPGRDGVGDYTRRLACELIRKGHQVGLIALNDQYSKGEVDDTQESDCVTVPVLRLPSDWKMVHRFQKASEWIDNFSPQWLSLQFVPFAFHPKGLSFEMGKLLQKIGNGKNWHIMVHELWIGMHIGASNKESLWGYVQRHLILSMISRLQPKSIHTQCGLYKAQLSKSGVNASLLPLFSNIPAIKEKDVLQHKKEKITFALFGEIHAGAPVQLFAKEVKSYIKKTGVTVELLLLGRSGNEKKHWEQVWKENELEINAKGELSTEEISNALLTATYGITTCAYEKVEKSGSVAAMKEHGLHVICVAVDWQPKAMPLLDAIPGIWKYKAGELESVLQSKTEAVPFLKLEGVAGMLIDSFKPFA